MTAIILLSVIGIVAIIVELVLPGGILGAIGFLCLIAAVVMTFVNFGPIAGTVAVVILFIFALLSMAGWMKFFHRLPLTRKLILKDASGADHEKETQQSLIGKTGVAVTDLTPSGHAKIDGKKRDVMSEASSIPKGTEVEIVAMRGPSVMVRAIDRGT